MKDVLSYVKDKINRQGQLQLDDVQTKVFFRYLDRVAELLDEQKILVEELSKLLKLEKGV